MSLQRFFGLMTPFLTGRATAESVEAGLAPCPSGLSRLQVYRDLVRWDHHNVMEKLYPVTRKVSGGIWEELVTEFLWAHPPTHWEINRSGEAFSQFLRRKGSDWPFYSGWMADVALYEWIDFVTYTSAEEHGLEAGAIRINPTFRADLFGHEIGAWFQRGDAHKDKVEPPGIKEHVLITYRDPQSLTTRFLEATPWVMLVLTAIENNRPLHAAATEAGVEEKRVESVVQELIGCGLLFR